jgi:hypothetical protein
MQLDIPIGKDKHATINEPTRDKFSANLGGAVEYSFAHLVYKILEIMGGGLGAFLGGAGVQFLEAVEPSLVEYTQPLIDLILKQDNLDANLRTFFTQLRSPAHEGAATILSGLASQAGGAVAGTVLSAILHPVTNALNAAVRGSVPSVTDLWAMAWRGKITDADAQEFMKFNGYKDGFLSAYGALARPRAGIGDLLTSAYRGTITFAQFTDELAARGFENADINVFTANYTQLMDFNMMLPALYKGVLSISEVVSRMEKLGWSAEDVSVMLVAAKPMPGPGDLIRFGVREAYNDSVAQQFGYDQDLPGGFTADMAKLGYDPKWSTYFWRAHWELPSVTQAAEMVHRGIISEGEFEQLLHLADYAPAWRPKMTQTIYNPYTRVDVRRMYGQGILTREQVKQAYMDGGYNDEHAENLTEWTIKYEDGNGGSIPEALKGITEGVITSAVAKGMMSDGDAHTALVDLKNSPEVSDLMIKLAHWKAAVAAKPEPIPEFAKDVRAITERAYLNGLVDMPTAKSQLTEVGYTGEEADFILRAIDYARAEREQEDQLTLISNAYLAGSLTRVDVVTRLGALDLPATQQDLLLDKWDSVLALPNRRLTEAQYRGAFKLGLITATDYTQFMSELGYSVNDVLLLTAMYTAPIAPTEETV